MAYHSAFNTTEARQLSTLPLLAIKTEFRGPASKQTTPDEDIIDEAVNYFRANILFRNFEVKGPADKLLIYLTLYVHQCLIRIQGRDKDSALKTLQGLAIENFPLPGEANGGALAGFLPPTNSRGEADELRAYLTQLRNETGVRLCDQVYAANPRVANKHWMMWSKRKFLNRSLEPAGK